MLDCQGGGLRQKERQVWQMSDQNKHPVLENRFAVGFDTGKDIRIVYGHGDGLTCKAKRHCGQPK